MLGSADLQNEIRVLAMTLPRPPRTPLFQTQSAPSDWLLPHSHPGTPSFV